MPSSIQTKNIKSQTTIQLLFMVKRPPSASSKPVEISFPKSFLWEEAVNVPEALSDRLFPGPLQGCLAHRALWLSSLKAKPNTIHTRLKDKEHLCAYILKTSVFRLILSLHSEIRILIVCH